MAPILAAFGVSLVERAAIDAFCRAKDISFAQAVRQNALGIRLGNLHAALAGQEPHELRRHRAEERALAGEKVAKAAGKKPLRRSQPFA